MDRRNRSPHPVGGSGGILPWKIFKIELLTNRISGLPSPNQRVTVPHFQI